MELPRASPLLRLVLPVLGFFLPLAFWMAFAVLGVMLAQGRPHHAGVALSGLFGSVVPLLLVLVYLPFAWARIHRTSATLPMRILGCRFVRSDGTRAGFLRILFLWWLPGFLFLVFPSIVGSKLLSEPWSILAAVASGPLLHLGDALSANRAHRRTVRDQVAGLVMVKT